MQRGAGLPAIFGRVRLWARLGAVAFALIGAVLAGPTLVDQLVNYETLDVKVMALAADGNPIVAVPVAGGMRRVEVPELAGVHVGDRVEVHRRLDDRSDIRVLNLDRAYIIALVSVGLAWFAWGAGGKIADADELARADQAAQAGPGLEVVMASEEIDGSTGLLRAVTADPPPPRPPLTRLADEVVDSLGGSGLAIGMTVFTWAFFGFIVLGFDGMFEGHVLSVGAIIALLAATAIAAAIITFRHRLVLSNRDGAAHRDFSCLGWRRRRSRPLAGFDRVELQHKRMRNTSSSKNRATPLTVDHFKVLLRGDDDELELADFRDPFRAHTRAQQLAAYLDKPYAEPEVTDPAAVKLYKP